MLPGSSFWKKSKTPCWPGCLPVTSEVHAGGVSGGMIERSTARVPRAEQRAQDRHHAALDVGVEHREGGPVQAEQQGRCGRLIVTPPGGSVDDAAQTKRVDVGDADVALLDGRAADLVEELRETGACRTAAGPSSRARRSPATRDRGRRRSGYRAVSRSSYSQSPGPREQSEVSRRAPAGRVRSSHSHRSRFLRRAQSSSGHEQVGVAAARRGLPVGQAVKASPPTSTSTRPRSASIAARGGHPSRPPGPVPRTCRRLPSTPAAQQPLVGLRVERQRRQQSARPRSSPAAAKPSGPRHESARCRFPVCAASGPCDQRRERGRLDRAYARATRPGPRLQALDRRQDTPPARRWSSGSSLDFRGPADRSRARRAAGRRRLLRRGASGQPLERLAPGTTAPRTARARAGSAPGRAQTCFHSAASAAKPRVQLPAANAVPAARDRAQAACSKASTAGSAGRGGSARKTLGHVKALVLPAPEAHPQRPAESSTSMSED